MLPGYKFKWTSLKGKKLTERVMDKKIDMKVFRHNDSILLCQNILTTG